MFAPNEICRVFRLASARPLAHEPASARSAASPRCGGTGLAPPATSVRCSAPTPRLRPLPWAQKNRASQSGTCRPHEYEGMTGSRPEAAQASPEELIRRAARGDVAAFARIVRIHNEDMTRVAFVITGDLDSATEVTAAAWSVAWQGLRSKRTSDGLGPWLCSLVATEAVMVAMCDGAPGMAGPAEPDDPAESQADGGLGGRAAHAGLERAIARIDPGDRALLALRHVGGLSMAELTRMNRRSRPPVAARFERLTNVVGGPQPPGSDLAMIERLVEQRLLGYASVTVRPIDADAAARRARAGGAFDLTRVLSVAISVVIGALVAGLPYLARLFQGQ